MFQHSDFPRNSVLQMTKLKCQNIDLSNKAVAVTLLKRTWLYTHNLKFLKTCPKTGFIFQILTFFVRQENIWWDLQSKFLLPARLSGLNMSEAIWIIPVDENVVMLCTMRWWGGLVVMDGRCKVHLTDYQVSKHSYLISLARSLPAGC